jgi:hypothetical protein
MAIDGIIGSSNYGPFYLTRLVQLCVVSFQKTEIGMYLDCTSLYVVFESQWKVNSVLGNRAFLILSLNRVLITLKVLFTTGAVEIPIFLSFEQEVTKTKDNGICIQNNNHLIMSSSIEISISLFCG